MLPIYFDRSPTLKIEVVSVFEIKLPRLLCPPISRNKRKQNLTHFSGDTKEPKTSHILVRSVSATEFFVEVVKILRCEPVACLLMRPLWCPGDLFDMLLPMLSIYQEYVRNHHYSLQVLTECKQSTLFAALLARLENKPACQGRSLETFLTYPMHQV